jgi:hypothetical protein
VRPGADGRAFWRPPAWALALTGFFAAYVVVTWPLVSRFWHATYGGPGDGWALIWQTRFRFDHGVSYFSPTYSRTVGWPLGAHFPSSLYLSNAAIELPNLLLLALGIGDVTAYNLITLAAGLTSSLAMYALLRQASCRPSVAFWGGLAYLIAPWHLEKLGIHPTLASMAALPLLLLGIVEWIGRPTLRAGALIVGAAALATYTHSYYGVAAGAVLVISLPAVLAFARKHNELVPTSKRTLVLAGALLLVPLPLALALHLQSSTVSILLDRPLYLTQYAAHPYLWLLPSTDNPVFGSLSRRYISSRALPLNEGELALYIGWLTIALAAVALITAWRRRAVPPLMAVAALTAIAGILLSLPGSYSLPLLGTVKMPIAYLNEVVKFVSTPARFFALTLTGFVALAALGLEVLARRLNGVWALVIVAVACVVSALELPFFRAGHVIDTRPPPVVQAIETTVPRGEPVAQYPSMENSYLPIAKQLFYQLAHGRPLVNGAPPASPADAVRLAVEDEQSAQTPRILALLGIHWVTYDPAETAEKAHLVGTPVANAYDYRPPAGFRVVRRLHDGSMLMRVTAKPAAAFASIAAGFSSSGRWLIRRQGTLLACATARGAYLLQFKAGAFGHRRSVRIATGPVISVPGSPNNPIRAYVRLHPGWQLLRLTLIGRGPTRPSDVIPGDPDTRPLVVTIGPISIRGPRGPAAACRNPPRDDKIPVID